MKGNTGTRTASRLSKKIFVVGKVYDTALMTDDRIRDAVQKDLNDYIGTGKVDFNIHTGPDMISLVFTRFTDYYGQRNADLTGEMMDADAFMITGEGYNGFHMPFMFPTAPFGYTPYLMDHLTSSTCHPKFIREQWSNALMAFHQHSSVDCLLVLRQCNLYGHYSFSKFENLVHTHIYT